MVRSAVGIWIGRAVERQAARGPGARVACSSVERARRWPRPPALWPAREGAAGMRLGRTDEGRPPEGRGSLGGVVAVERDRRWPRPPARGPVREGAAGIQIGSAGGSNPIEPDVFHRAAIPEPPVP